MTHILIRFSEIYLHSFNVNGKENIKIKPVSSTQQGFILATLPYTSYRILFLFFVLYTLVYKNITQINKS